MSINVCSREEKGAIAQALEGFKFTSPYGPEIKKWLRHGIGLHHAGLLPKYRVLVEQLAQRGLLKVICGTDTLGVGINVPIRTVLLTQLCKYNGEKTAILSARDFHQVTGRAGRKGFDDTGWVVAQAPAHAIENLQLEQKQAATGKKFVKRKPPERNFVNWDKQTFQRLIGAPPERLQSQFKVTHAMLLNVLSRPGDGGRAMQKLIRDSHETAAAKKGHRKRAWQLFRSLVERGIVELRQRGAEGPKLRMNVELQEDFALNQTLALYLVDTLPLMDPAAADYALVVLSLAEAILEDPDFILRKQLDRVKSQALAEMKAEGLSYEQRMEELEKLEHPKPNRDFIYSTFNAFAARHPWVGQENIRPKSIAREMFEEFRSFSDYIKVYELQRVEGLLLRHLSSVYKVLAQTVPDAAKDGTLREMELYLRGLLRQVDSSLLDEWERMRDPGYQPLGEVKELRPPGAEEAEADFTRNAKVFTAAIRTRVFAFLRAVADGEFEAAAEMGGWSAEKIRAAVDEYRREHSRIRLDAEARNARHTYVRVGEDGKTWTVEQMLVDPEELNDWVAEFEVDVVGSRERQEVVMALRRIGAVGGGDGLSWVEGCSRRQMAAFQRQRGE
jgi:superfamily II RNA helicase